MLGSLNPEKVKDLAMHSPGGSLDDAPVLPRVKTTTDFSWLSKPFREMTDKELKGYSLLIAVGECCRDHFLNVRGLVRVGKIGATKQGLLSYLAFMELLKKFRVTHGLETSSELQEFMRMVDPCSAGLLDPVELEKAISAVREDEARRRPKAPPKGGQFAATLGEQARRLSNLPNEVDVKGAEVPCAFGTAAFIESLLLLGYRHMNGSGQPIKCCAPAAAKAMYLINFLHHQHDRLAKEVVWRREQEKAAAAEQAATVLVRPRSPPPAPTPKALVIPRVSAMNKMVGAARKVLRAQREARSNQHRNAVVTAVDIPDTDAGTSPSGNSSPSQSSSRCALEPGPEPPLSSRGNVPPKERQTRVGFTFEARLACRPYKGKQGEEGLVGANDSRAPVASDQEEKPVHWPDSAAYTTAGLLASSADPEVLGFSKWGYAI
ncbi:unnamed protein product [Effrenium voratum]|uniref:EF-hand domain-containing protein n=1 Tax=Effrenium voratum TaxID=2562239 RepID=A0AA36NBJ1_9DINO|nr:unnamed protein product [Effrenium voratum]